MAAKIISHMCLLIFDMYAIYLHPVGEGAPAQEKTKTTNEWGDTRVFYWSSICGIYILTVLAFTHSTDTLSDTLCDV